MKLITRQSKANQAAARFEELYRLSKGCWRTDWAEVMWKNLKSLGANPNPDDVDKVIGNGSWTSVPACDECGKSNLPMIIQVGEELDDNSSTAELCKDCVAKALDMFGATNEH